MDPVIPSLPVRRKVRTKDCSSGCYIFFVGHYRLGYYPAAGLRLYNTGSLANVTTSGYVWSASQSVATLTYSAYLLFHSGVVYPTGNNARAYGLTVRCVAAF